MGHQSLRERFGPAPLPASFVDGRPRCVDTPFDVCDSRVTVSSMGPEQGCFSSPGDEASGKFLVTSFHSGTSNEMSWLSDKLGLKTNIGGFCAHVQASHGNENNPYVFSNDRVDSIWQDKPLATRLESYAGVISTDTSLAIYTFLRNPAFEHKPLIIWITNRYDTTMSDHMPRDSFDAFLKAMEFASCCRKNVFFVAAHASEIEFARVKYPNMDVSRWRTIYPIGHESNWFHREMSAEHGDGANLGATPFKSDKLCVYPNENEQNIFEDYRETLAKASVHYDDALGSPAHRSYGGPRGLSVKCKGILHVPYAPNTMTLWENVQIGNIFFLPSAKLVAHWRATDKIKVFQMSRGVGGLDRELTEDFLNRTEWYRQDRRPLFVYFDSPADLVVKFTTLDFEKKRKEIRAYMDRHEEEQLSKWKDLFAEAAKDKSDGLASYAENTTLYIDAAGEARVLRLPDNKKLVADKR